MTASTTPPKHNRSTGRTTLIIGGAVLVPLALVLLIAGGALVGAYKTHRNSDGFYTTTGPPVTSPTHALVSDRLDFGTDGPGWLFRNSRLGTISVSATGTHARPIFVGVARASDVDAYLRGTALDRVSDFNVEPLSLSLHRRSGESRPEAPTGENIWAAKATGAARQTVTWSVRKGAWDIVVMNADGSAGISTNLTVGAKAGFVFWIGVGLLIAGGVLLVGGALAVVLGLTARKPA